VCPALEQIGFCLGSLLQDRQRAWAPARCWAVARFGPWVRARVVWVGRLGWAALAGKVPFLL
jgi:hypothetical protein